MSLLDWFIAACTLAVGFFVGLVALGVGNLFALGFWLVALFLVLVGVLVAAFEILSDWLFGNLVFKTLGGRKTEEMRAQDRKMSRVGRYTFALGMVAALMAAQIWTLDEIMEAF